MYVPIQSLKNNNVKLNNDKDNKDNKDNKGGLLSGLFGSKK